MKLLLLPTALLCLSLPAPAPADEAPAEDGPANVLLTLRRTVTALDAGDTDWLRSVFAERMPDHLYGWDGPDVSTEAMGEVEDRSLAFAGVRPDGAVWSASDRASALEAFAAQAASGVRTTLLQARASCDSERASWVVATLERRHGEGDAERVQRVQLTAVMAWEGGAQPFRIWHWQAVELPVPVRELR